MPHAERLSTLNREAARTLILRAPRWERVAAGPAIQALLVGLLILCGIGLQRMVIGEPARFNWQAVAGGWIGIAALAWAAYMVQENREPGPRGIRGPGAAKLLNLMLAQSVVVSVLYAALTLVVGSALPGTGKTMLWLAAGSWMGAGFWAAGAQAVLLLRQPASAMRRLLAVSAVVAGTVAATYVLPDQQFWYPEKSADVEGDRQLHLSQQTIEAQQTLTATTFAAILPQRPGIIDVYGLTFAPYAEESVFRKESAMVAEVLRKRFDAGGRTMQLVNHRETSAEFPWATPWNLQRAIDRMAALMNRDEDILFLHVTSHGAKDGILAADFWPLDVDQITPFLLKQWLDAAGVRYRVLSISACYAGAWIDALATPGSLVMTASDATHTSYGCGHKSELTFFGRAMYDEQLRNKTLSFEQAFAASREIIRVREVEAGKDDGYSNPQIRVGADIRARLAKLEAELPSRSKSGEKSTVPAVASRVKSALSVDRGANSALSGR